MMGLDLDGSVVEPVRITDIARVMRLNESNVCRIAQPWRNRFASKACAAMEGRLKIDPSIRDLDRPAMPGEFGRVRGLLAANSWRSVRVSDGATIRDVQIATVLHELRYGPDLDYLVGLRADAKTRAV